MNYTPLEVMTMSEYKRKIVSLFIGIVVGLFIVWIAYEMLFVALNAAWCASHVYECREFFN